MPLLQDGRPSKDWLTWFMNRWDMSLKQPSPLEKTRKAAASDPKIIYGYYDLLEKTMRKLAIFDRPDCVFNVDETNLTPEPLRTKVVANKGKKASRLTATSGRDSISVMAAISADGHALPPLIIFKGNILLVI